MAIYIDKTAIIDKGTKIGDGTKIWHWSHISSNASIGKNCIIGQNVFIGNNVSIGDNCKIQNNISIYAGVEIGNNVFCGPSVVFTNVINPRSEINRKKEFKKTIIEDGVTLGANSTIVCGIKIFKYAFIAAGAVVTKNVKAFSLVMGVPAEQKSWMSKYGSKLNLPLNGKGQTKCKISGENYMLQNDQCVIVEKYED